MCQAYLELARLLNGFRVVAVIIVSVQLTKKVKVCYGALYKFKWQADWRMCGVVFFLNVQYSLFMIRIFNIFLINSGY